jgi:mono/diheme cytochrome c family protein
MKYSLLTIVILLTLVACNAGPNQTNIEVIQNMMDQVSIKSQDWDPSQGDKMQMRTPPAGTIPRGQPPYKYMTDPGGAEKDTNPLAGDMSPATLTVGRKHFDIYCAVCHAADGSAKSPVADKMAVKPRNLISPEATAYSDGRIYFAITAGRGVMGSYASQIPDSKTRWAVVNYVRTLQKQTK